MYNQDNLNRAWFMASQAHKDQIYPRGALPYITHVGEVMMEVMSVASELNNPELALLCAILHDTLEDTTLSYEVLLQTFGQAVAQGVLALSKEHSLSTKQARMEDSLTRIHSQPHEIWVVKLADRIANLGEPPHHWSLQKRQAYQEEARLILASLRDANATLALRLSKKIEAYGRYCCED